jgi:hypothetical protein
MIKHNTVESFYTRIPVFGSVIQISALRCLAEIPLELIAGQFIDVRARLTATSEDLADRDKNVNFVRRIRIEPTSRENWGANTAPGGNDDYCAFGQVGFRFNGNISKDMHHFSPEITSVWEVTESGLWYIKLCSRAHSSDALPSDKLNIDRLELEVLVF